MQVFLVVIIYQLYCHLCIGRRIKGIAFPGKFFPEFLIVLDNTVVYAYYITVIGDMGMGITLGGLTVGSPTGMTDTTGTHQSLPIIGFLLQYPKPSLGLHYLDIFLSVPHSQTGRIITSVFQF
jgi:hypothetical protein